MRFESDMSRRVRDVMTPMPLITAPVGVSNDDALRLLSQNKIEKLPIVDGNDRLQGLITVKDFVKKDQYPLATKDDDGRLRVAAAVGFFDDAYKRAMALVDAGVDAIVVDVAQGHGKGVLDMVARLKKRPGCGPRRRHRRQRRHPCGRAGPRRRRRGRREVWGWAWIDLHDPGGRGGGRPAGHRDLARRLRRAAPPVCR